MTPTGTVALPARPLQPFAAGDRMPVPVAGPAMIVTNCSLSVARNIPPFFAAAFRLKSVERALWRGPSNSVQIIIPVSPDGNPCVQHSLQFGRTDDHMPGPFFRRRTPWQNNGLLSTFEFSDRTGSRRFRGLAIRYPESPQDSSQGAAQHEANCIIYLVTRPVAGELTAGQGCPFGPP